MTQSTKSISPLRQRMIEDMTLRKLSPKTQIAYIRAVKNFTRFFGRSPDTAEAEDLRRYQLHLVEHGVSRGSLNAQITGLKFFFEVTVDRPEAMKKMRHVYEPRKLPEVLSVEEITRLLQAAGSRKYQAALGVAYGAGLRASEVVHLKVPDIDSERMVLRVEQGKGKKDRYAMLSPALLELLRAWWRQGRAQHKLLPGPSTWHVTPPRSTSTCRCILYAMRSPRICSSTTRISASSRSCSDTRNSRTPPATARSRRVCCAR
jgi:site-specific recombinase XerD